MSRQLFCLFITVFFSWLRHCSSLLIYCHKCFKRCSTHYKMAYFLNVITLRKCVFIFLFRVKEACILLNLLPGSAVLLRNLLKSSGTNQTDGERGDHSAIMALTDIGVHRLTPEDALKVLNLRVQLPDE